MNNEEKILAMLEKHGEMLEKHSVILTQMQEEQKQMREDIHRINARLDFDVEKRIDAINEGVDAILEAVVPKSRVERLEDDVIILKTAVKMLTQEVSELKKAQ